MNRWVMIGAAIVVIAVAVIAWRLQSRGAATAHAPPTAPSIATSPKREPARTVRRITTEERAQLAERIEHAQRTAASPVPQSDTAKPALPGSPPMATPDDVMRQVLPALQSVKDQVLDDCVKDTQLGGFEATLSLTGDADIGTLVDAGALRSLDHQPIPAELDTCVRDVMQHLELPPIDLKTRFEITYVFKFHPDDDEAPK